MAGLFYDLRPGDRLINGFPLFHVAGSFVYGLAAVAAGATLVLPTRLGYRHTGFMKNYWRFAAREHVTMLSGVPTILATLLEVPRGTADLSAVRAMFTGGAPLPPELAAAFERQHGIPVRNIFGMTECAGLVAIEPLRAPRVPGSVGLPLPFSDVLAVELGSGRAQLDRKCAPGETGVIVLRGPHVSPGYTDPARNDGVFESGWLVSGDIGHIDDAGRVHLSSRAKDLIIRGGHNIDPALIEEVAQRHPAVAMAAAVGAPDAYAGELPVLFVTLKPGAETSEPELLEFLGARVAERPALPKRVTILESMPVTAIGKTYKPALRARALERALGEHLSPAAAGETSIRVEGSDEGGRIGAIVHVSGCSDCKGTEAEISGLLRNFAIGWRIAWH